MELWIPLAIAAAFLQNTRSALQKRLKDSLTTWGATAARFVFAAPLAVLLATALLAARGEGVPGGGPVFLAYAAAGGLAQIGATVLLVHLFSYRNFTVATAFTKTEPVQTALFGIVVLGDHLSMGAAAGIMVSLVGVILISAPPGRMRGQALLDRKALIGIASGGLFGLSAVAYRGASLSLSEGEALIRAGVTLAAVTTFQAVVMLIWLAWREKGQIGALFAAWRVASLVGLTGMLASLCWFTAFTLENAAYVRALGQVEVVFMIGASVLFFRERVAAREITGAVLVSLGIVLLVWLAS